MKSQCFNYLLSLPLIIVGALGWSSSAYARSDAELQAEAAREFARLKASAPLTTDRETIDYISCVANAVVSVLEQPYSDYNWEMAILETDQINAFVMPGGKIVVKSGILTVAENQHQLAAVLGHEAAHVTAHHANERATRGEITSYGVEVLALILGGGYYTQTQGAYGAASALNTLGLMNPFSRMQESEADAIGLEYMSKAGFDPRESVKLWQNMNKSEKTTKVPEFMSTHPSGETRIESMVERLPEMLALYNQAQADGRNPDCRR